MKTRLLVTLISLSCLVAGPTLAQRSMYWKELAVSARLDGEGVLHVEETHSIVFSGDWNGGERIFSVPWGQKIELNRMTRIDPASGSRRDVTQGRLDELDRYDWVDGQTLRWRSRLPSDPSFAATPIVYVIGHTLRGALASRGGAYRLNHDFAFPDREWLVERFVLDFEIDPVWELEGIQERTFRYAPGPLPPGKGFVVTASLTHGGEAPPLAVRHPSPRSLRVALLVMLAVFVAWQLLAFALREQRPGRWAGLPESSIDPAQVASRLLVVPPEIAGALWDRAVGAPEVAATLARLVAEGKLASRVRTGSGRKAGPGILELELLVDTDSLRDYEALLVDKLFVDGPITDTAKVRAHYKSSGFDPASLLSKPIMEEVERTLGSRPTPRQVRWKLPAALGATAFLTLVAACFVSSFNIPAAALGGMTLAVLWGTAAGLASVVGRAVSSLAAKLAGSLLPLVVASAAYAALLASEYPVSELTLVGLGLGLAAAFGTALACATSRDSGPALAWRRQLAALREAIRHELARPEPALRDEWFPWIVALGLGPQVERWARKLAVAAPGTRSSTVAASGLSLAPGGSSSGWSGGGGAFGGAGASASWAAAAGAISAGVASPSSSGSGGSSSGGGGGGGW